MKLLRSFGVALGVSAVVGATMLASAPLEKPEAGSQQADVRVVAAIPPPKPGDFKSVLRVEGMTKIAKLGQAMSIGRGKFKALITPAPEGPSALIGEMLMPPAPGYFVVFRFVPVTNNTSFVQVGDATGTIDIEDFAAAETKVKVKLNLVISEVKQNGVPLDVGPNCRTVTPVDLELSGTINLGARKVNETEPVVEADRAATIKTSYTIPAFTGCGATENLSPLMTGLVSGPGNELITYLYNHCFGTSDCNKYW
ncbi:hypothetical protein [Actinokineospora xionganensis]|uniref:Secreted protein n=1 Tax=Actinokineospora xionganensis TaxID=2684470 RepID=A0ABR7LD49_9PSEU|nr:hypothetical protein [Actinokineospora xionganensis]MBC6450579.1 hypothetical protein [Actinokineospora xionganensis]